MNKQTNSCGFFDSFGRNFSWLEDTLKNILTLYIKLDRHTVDIIIYMWVTHLIFHNKNDGSDE